MKVLNGLERHDTTEVENVECKKEAVSVGETSEKTQGSVDLCGTEKTGGL